MISLTITEQTSLGFGEAKIRVRFGSKADIRSAIAHVRFTPESGHVQCISPCPLSANSGHSHGASNPFVLNVADELGDVTNNAKSLAACI